MHPLVAALTLFLFAADFLLALILLDAESQDEPRRRLERVEARRQALRKSDRPEAVTPGRMLARPVAGMLPRRGRSRDPALTIRRGERPEDGAVHFLEERRIQTTQEPLDARRPAAPGGVRRRT